MTRFNELLKQVGSNHNRVGCIQLDLEEMLRLGLDPTKDLRGEDLSAVQFGYYDLDGWDFSGANLTRADLYYTSNARRAIFDKSTRLDGVRLPRGLRLVDLTGIYV